MKKAIGTSIRSATSDLRKLERYRQQQLHALQNDENIDPNERDEMTNATNDIETMLDGIDDMSDDDEDKIEDDDADEGEHEDEDGDENEGENESEDEDEDKEVGKLMIDEDDDE
jgi:hypothetical protein